LAIHLIRGKEKEGEFQQGANGNDFSHAWHEGLGGIKNHKFVDGIRSAVSVSGGSS
jgi:hypothetical protein